MTQLTTIYINSKDRLNYSNTNANNFTVNLSPFGLVNVKSYVIKSVTIPYSFYTTSYYNNNNINPGTQYFTLEEDAFAGPYTVTVLIPFGNYSYSELSTLIQNQLNAAGSPLTDKPYSVTYNTANNKFTFSSSSTVVNFKLLFSGEYTSQPDYKKISTIMGFTTDDYTSSSIGGANQSITSPLTSNLSGGYNVIIKSDTLTYQNTNFFNNKVNTCIIGIPLISAPNGIIFWEDQQLLLQRCRASLMNTLNFQLVDDYDNPIDLNGLDWAMVICFYSDLI